MPGSTSGPPPAPTERPGGRIAGEPERGETRVPPRSRQVKPGVHPIGAGLRGGGLGEVAAVPGEDAVPAVDGGFGTVGGTVHREERVPGTLVGGELVRLAVVLQFLLELVHLLRRRVLVVRAEQAEQPAG